MERHPPTFEVFWAVLSSDGCLHRVYVQHNQITGHRVVAHNGVRVADERILCDIGSRHELPLLRGSPPRGGRGGRRSPPHRSAAAEVATVVIASCRMGTAYRYDLQVDNMPHAEWNASVHKRARVVAFDISSAWPAERPCSDRAHAFLTYTPSHQRIFTGGSFMLCDPEAALRLPAVSRHELYGITRELVDAVPDFPMDERSGTIHTFTLARRDVICAQLQGGVGAKVSDEELVAAEPSVATAFELHADLVTEAFSLTAAVAEQGVNVDAAGASKSENDTTRASFPCVLGFDALLAMVPELAQPFVLERGKPLRTRSDDDVDQVACNKTTGGAQVKKKSGAAAASSSSSSSSWFRRRSTKKK
jgi:hypothetical protein